MNTKTLILLGGFLFTLSSLFAQRLQEGLSIGVPALVQIMTSDVYYNTISSGSKWWEDLEVLAPGYMLTYTFAGNGKDQWFARHTAFVASFWRVYDRDPNPWDYPEFFFLLGGGRTHYLPFAPSLQWQWETGLHLDRLWRGVGYREGNPDARTEWKTPYPYLSLRLQTTAIGKHLVLGLGANVLMHENFSSFLDELRLTSYASWDLSARNQPAQKRANPLPDEHTPLSIQLHTNQYLLFNGQSISYSTRLNGLSVAYLWGHSEKLRWANRVGLGLGYFDNGSVPNASDGNQWFLQGEQNLYWRFAKLSPILPFAGVGLIGGQVGQVEYDQLGNRSFLRRNIFRPYAQIGARLHRPQHQLFLEFAITSFPATHVGLGFRFKDRGKVSP